jgi:UDP-sugar pyrophosphorylase
LKKKWNPNGDVAGKDGYSPFPGNTNTLVFKLKPYIERLETSKGVIPEFVNPKYADAERTRFKSPFRLECMMQDYPKFVEGGQLGFTMYPTWFCFSPAKNDIHAALDLWKRGMPCFAMASSEYD